MSSADGRDRALPELYESEARNLRLMLCGDVMLTRRLAVYREPRYLALRDLLHAADAVFANFESSAHDYAGSVPNLTDGTYMTTEPNLLPDLKWLGVTFVSTANNHAYDYGDAGVLANIQHLAAAGIPQAGSGRHLREARSPGYVDTPGGRIGLIAATATYRDSNPAMEQRLDALGKPGISPLGFETTYTVDQASLDALRRIGEKIGLDAEAARRAGWFFSPREAGVSTAGDGEKAYRFLGKRFVAGDGDDGGTFGVSTRPRQRDLDALLRQVGEARRQADWVLVSVHCHEHGGPSVLSARSRADLVEPADFLKEVAHRVIDAGADAFAGHGPHSTLGIEIYKGRPILYSLGDFIMENETVRFFPAHPYERFDLDPAATPADFLDARTDHDTKAHPAHAIYWESIVAECVFEAGQLARLDLHPIDLGWRKPRPQRGRPLLASGEVADRIVERLRELSRPFGTHIERRGTGASVALTSSASTQAPELGRLE